MTFQDLNYVHSTTRHAISVELEIPGKLITQSHIPKSSLFFLVIQMQEKIVKYGRHILLI